MGDVGALRTVRDAAGRMSKTAQWWLIPEDDPSFLSYFARHRRNYVRALREAERPWGSLWSWESKSGSRDLARRLGIPTASTLQGPATITDINWDALPETFVVKPTRGSSNTGVYVLKREESAFRDILRGGVLGREDICRAIADAGALGKLSAASIIVEEALLTPEGHGVNDWKCYAFQGEVPVILQMDRSPSGTRLKYYDESWRGLGRSVHRTAIDPTLTGPVSPAMLLDVAKRVSQEIPVPFARIDLYEHQGRVLLGEITPMPGSTQRFRRATDRAMGQAWERAEAKLLAAATAT